MLFGRPTSRTVSLFRLFLMAFLVVILYNQTRCINNYIHNSHQTNRKLRWNYNDAIADKLFVKQSTLLFLVRSGYNLVAFGVTLTNLFWFPGNVRLPITARWSCQRQAMRLGVH